MTASDTSQIVGGDAGCWITENEFCEYVDPVGPCSLSGCTGNGIVRNCTDAGDISARENKNPFYTTIREAIVYGYECGAEELDWCYRESVCKPQCTFSAGENPGWFCDVEWRNVGEITKGWIVYDPFGHCPSCIPGGDS
jgi:hypothetical protein